MQGPRTSSNLVLPILEDHGSCFIWLENPAVLVVVWGVVQHSPLRVRDRVRLMQIANIRAKSRYRQQRILILGRMWDQLVPLVASIRDDCQFYNWACQVGLFLGLYNSGKYFSSEGFRKYFEKTSPISGREYSQGTLRDSTVGLSRVFRLGEDYRVFSLVCFKVFLIFLSY